MKNTKRVYAEFAFFDRTGIQNFLERQAKKGWMLKSVDAFQWSFQRIEPKTIHYALHIFQQGIAQFLLLSKSCCIWNFVSNRVGNW